jgi:hypothetical protein
MLLANISRDARVAANIMQEHADLKLQGLHLIRLATWFVAPPTRFPVEEKGHDCTDLFQFVAHILTNVSQVPRVLAGSVCACVRVCVCGVSWLRARLTVHATPAQRPSGRKVLSDKDRGACRASRERTLPSHAGAAGVHGRHPDAPGPLAALKGGAAPSGHVPHLPVAPLHSAPRAPTTHRRSATSPSTRSPMPTSFARVCSRPARTRAHRRSGR